MRPCGVLLDCKTTSTRNSREHADLVRDVVPGPLAAQLLQVLAQQGAHGDDTLGHALHLLQGAKAAAALALAARGSCSQR